VHHLQLHVSGGRRALDGHPRLSEQAERTGQLDRQVDPDRRHRMVRAEVIGSQPFVPGHVQCAGHLIILSSHAGPESLTRTSSDLPWRGSQRLVSAAPGQPGRLRCRIRCLL
jgi:hypothetical protein